MKTKKLITVLLALLPAVSCQHKELCYSHPHGGSLQVVFDWGGVQEPIGQNMELFLFRSGGGRPLHYQFYDIHGGVIDVPSGRYRAICVNMGTGANHFTDESDLFDDFTVTTRSVIAQQESILEPDILYSDHSRVEIDIDDNGEQTLVMYPVQRTPRYTVIVRNVGNLGGARNCLASLSNLSGGYLAVSDTPSDAGHIQIFEMVRTGETTLEGKVTIFGHRHSECGNHILALRFSLQDGKEFVCTADVSDRMTQLAEAGSMTGEIVVELDIDIPESVSNGSGFQPTVDGWKGEEKDLSI